MRPLLSAASWNVEHFVNAPDRVRDCVAFIEEADPDVFALFEVLGRDVFEAVVHLMPSHHCYVTEGEGALQTLVGVRRNLTAFVTQRHQFKSDVPTLRPGTLVTVVVEDVYYSLLFLHLKSLNDPRSWGLRDDMIGHVYNLKKALDRATADPDGARFVCMGDLNTMGMNLTYSDGDVAGADELRRYARRLRRRGLRLLSKTAPATWWGGAGTSLPPSDLDHVFASDHLAFRRFGDAEAQVRGWPELAGDAERDAWIRTHSDHAMLFVEIVDPA